MQLQYGPKLLRPSRTRHQPTISGEAACALRTISDDAAMVIASLVPLGELVREAKELHPQRTAPQNARSETK